MFSMTCPLAKFSFAGIESFASTTMFVFPESDEQEKNNRNKGKRE